FTRVGRSADQKPCRRRAATSSKGSPRRARSASPARSASSVSPAPAPRAARRRSPAAGSTCRSAPSSWTWGEGHVARRSSKAGSLGVVGVARASAARGAPTLAGSEFDLRVGAELVNVSGRPGLATLVNGSLPAPTLRWREGDVVTLRVHNELANQHTSIHWHG